MTEIETGTVRRETPAIRGVKVTQKCTETIASNSHDHSISYNSMYLMQAVFHDDVVVPESLTVV